MKFLCDRCKTRYSIGDDRVRGKILKIRCKNCANVITVREGMTDADASEPAAAPRRTGKPTTMSPPIAAATPAAMPPATNGAAAGKPPAALEEEWYVSIDGDQEGPFSLSDAQRWIARKAFDADLHCWSEGFDDWLPVDKVSHFRGLRKRPAPATSPPPLPRATGAVPALRAPGRPAAPKEEDEPKPLFAATMASLEKSAAQAAVGVGMPAASVAAPRPAPAPISPGPSRYPSPLSGTPAIPSIQAKSNGTGPARVPVVPAIATPKPLLAKPSPSGPVPRAETRPGLGGQFDAGNDQATQIESPAFDLEASTKAEPVASQAKRAASESADAFGRSVGRDSGPTQAIAQAFDGPTTAPSALPLPSNPHGEADDDDEDDGMEIGEVSRVVKLADLLKPAPKKRAETATPNRGTASSPALSRTGAVAKLNSTAPVMRIEDPNGANGAFLPGSDPSVAPGSELAMQPQPVATSHKKGLIILIGVAALLLAGVVVAVVMLAGGGDTTDHGLGSGEKIDTTRPDDPLRPRQPNETGSAGSAVAVNPFFPPKNPYHPPKNPNQNNQNPGNLTGSNGSGKDPNELPTGDSLSPEDIDSVSKKYSSGTQRCYMRSQKGTDAITIGNVKSIQATLTVGKDGAVTEVSLASHADDNLGKCLINALHGWRFRTNPGGRIKFTLAFASG